MAQKLKLNYPDLLGDITGGPRLNTGVLQAALANRPRIARAGHPIHMVLLLQNAADCPVDVSVTLHLPERDARKQKGRFTAKVSRLAVGMQAAEVGVVSLPVMIEADTAPGRGYKVSVELGVKALEKAQRIRLPEGGAAPDLGEVPQERLDTIDALRKLSFSAQASGMRLRSGALEVSFNVLTGKLEGGVDEASLKPGWTSLWTMEDYQLDEDVSLLRKYHEEMKTLVLPSIDREKSFDPLKKKTEEAFSAGGYPLKEDELGLVTRLLTVVLEYAAANVPDNVREQFYPMPSFNTRELVNEAEYLVSDEALELPHWSLGLLRRIEIDRRAAKYPIRALLFYNYPDLLKDAVTLAFSMIEQATGLEMGSDTEVQAFGEDLVESLAQGRLDFMSVMPVVLGGVLICDLVVMPKEYLKNILDDLPILLEKHERERSPETEEMFALAVRVIKIMLLKYGYPINID